MRLLMGPCRMARIRVDSAEALLPLSFDASFLKR